MSYKVFIVLNATGEGRWFESETPWSEGCEYLWTEGNFGCDCNRALFFYDWGAEADNYGCGDAAFSVPYAELPNGRRIMLDERSRA